MTRSVAAYVSWSELGSLQLEPARLGLNELARLFSQLELQPTLLPDDPF